MGLKYPSFLYYVNGASRSFRHCRREQARRNRRFASVAYDQLSNRGFILGLPCLAKHSFSSVNAAQNSPLRNALLPGDSPDPLPADEMKNQDSPVGERNPPQGLPKPTAALRPVLRLIQKVPFH